MLKHASTMCHRNNLLEDEGAEKQATDTCCVQVTGA
jgi:hypothetical protein